MKTILVVYLALSRFTSTTFGSNEPVIAWVEYSEVIEVVLCVLMKTKLCWMSKL